MILNLILKFTLCANYNFLKDISKVSSKNRAKVMHNFGVVGLHLQCKAPPLELQATGRTKLFKPGQEGWRQSHSRGQDVLKGRSDSREGSSPGFRQSRVPRP